VTSNAVGWESGTDLVIELSDRLRIARTRAGIEQEEMAIKLSVSSSTISNWENGRTSPRVPMLSAWAQITGFNMSSLISQRRSCAEPGKSEPSLIEPRTRDTDDGSTDAPHLDTPDAYSSLPNLDDGYVRLSEGGWPGH